MEEDTEKLSKDIKGAGKLTIQAIKGIANIVEALHYKILNIGGFYDASQTGKTKGITGAVYRNIQTITDFTGAGVNALLDNLSSTIDKQVEPTNRSAVVSALNGVLGDYLSATQNPLAISMQLRKEGQKVDQQELMNELKANSKKLLIMIHGLCMNDLQWLRSDHNHGENLAKELGFTPVYLYYNTGLHISENGRNFAELMNQLNAKLPFNTRIYILAHSMGGLLIRSACHYGKKSRWQTKIKKIVFLGTPHHGSPLEKAGNLVDIMLDSNPFSAPFSKLGKIRSCGITDLRFGNIVDEDWNTKNRFEATTDERIPIHLPSKIKCYTIAATLTKELLDNSVGDGLVPVSSALGKHNKPEYTLQFAETNQYIVRNINHLDLLNDVAVYAKIKEYFK